MDRRHDYLLDALDYGGELTPAENRRRINALRAGTVKAIGSKAKLPGQAPNAGASRRGVKEGLNMHPLINGRRTS